jgi:2-amino-4-hydroxy-6-hydroxymethyldihydropteridine diphosphokinase
MPRCLIGLGSNLGDRVANIDAALQQLQSAPGIALVSRSQFYVTAAIGGPPNQPNFLNAAACLETSLDPLQILVQLQHVENSLGRVRDIRWEARPIDLDLLLFDEQILMQPPHLVLPHPRLALRRFVLAPAAEIAGDWRHPQIGWTIAQLLQHLDTEKNYAAITGFPDGAIERLLRAAPIQALTTARLGRAFRDVAPARWLDEPDLWDRWMQDVLASDALPATENWLLSAFWIFEILARARRSGMSAGNLDRLRDEALRRSRQVAAPKLLVLALPDNPQTHSAESLGEWQPVLDHFFQGPVLKLNLSDERQAVAELEAALQGCRKS